MGHGAGEIDCKLIIILSIIVPCSLLTSMSYPEITCRLWNYDPSQDEEIYRAYKAQRNAGVTLFDTGDSYGTLDLNGRAEILLGQFERRYLEESASNNSQSNSMFDLGSIFGAKKSNSSNKQQVATKLAPYPWRITRGSLVQAAKDSLKRLEQDKLCVAQTHWSTANYQPFQEGK